MAGLRAEQAGFDGVEVHGAHGYLPCQFLDVLRNRRTDRYGGSAEGRARVLVEIVAGLRACVRTGFQIGVRLSPERYGVELGEMRALAQRLMTDGLVDYLDISCWDIFKRPDDPAYAGRALMDWFTNLDRGAALPVSRNHLAAEGLGERFVDYMATWKGFVAEEQKPG